MADELRRAGKYYAFNGGIATQIRKIRLVTAAESLIDEVALLGTEFETGTLDAQGDDTLENVTAIEFTVASGDVGLTAVAVILLDNALPSPREIARIDLNTNVTLDTEGIVSFSAGTLSATFPAV